MPIDHDQQRRYDRSQNTGILVTGWLIIGGIVIACLVSAYLFIAGKQ